MNIFGIGTDIVSIDRIKKSLKNKNFVNRIFNKKEILKCKKIVKSSNCYAKRFAAKEAFSKALGSLSHINTLAPDFKNLLVISRPNPWAPPVTIAVLFLKSKTIFSIKLFFC